jgi:hypothetical protein
LSTSTPDLAGPPSPDTDLALQRALVDAIAGYAARVREHGELPPFPAGGTVSATDVAVTAAAMLKASEIYSFEIAAMFNI